jgi:hypothetical protein
MQSLSLDVVVWDSMGLDYHENTTKNIGGTEFAVIRLVKSLKAVGKKQLHC